ncbi:MAG: squalene synthase HpnC [Candidatus Koribacter versatilis]|uniref:Squalene synthase HpnC n=1 Tax=Candidatus Korobacter versatilis TaxID=658062 RepID=A0A932EQG3_9BACT|nr:squalene synthase HpnC [Candidatus Koribacter versatilis]
MSANPTSVAASGFAGLPADYAIPERAPSLEEARRYCERLARSHYENFSVATWFLPERLKQHFFNLYAYCRISDDLADEVPDKRDALRLLDEWEKELNACYEASPRHPVFVALCETVRALDIPKQPFADLLVAFRRDQSTSRYETFDDVLGYCKYSANPVGRLVLYLCGYRDAERQQLSDYTCTALQLANFWQDVVRDWDKGRVYIPLADLRRFQVSEDDIAQRRATPWFLEMMKFEVLRAREWFALGLPLAGKVSKELATDIELFTRGGQAILDAIERQGYNVLEHRPVISKPRKLALVLRAGARKLLA